LELKILKKGIIINIKKGKKRNIFSKFKRTLENNFGIFSKELSDNIFCQ